MALTAAQHEQRQRGIGSSDAPAVLGLSPWRTPIELWLEKTGQAGRNDDGNEATHFGTLLEPMIATEYARRTGRRFRADVEPIHSHPQRPWQLATPDRVTTDGRIVEIKSAKWARGWTDDDDGIPIYYAAQVAHQLAVLDADIADVCVLIGGNELRIYTIDRDATLERALIEREDAFWQHVVQQTPPAPINANDVALLYPRDTMPSVVSTLETLADVDRLKALKADIKAMEKAAEQIDARVRLAFGEAAQLLDPATGQPLATFKAQTSNRFDQGEFKTAHPDLFQQYVRPSESRVLRLK